jgi:hypothetical protein
MTRDELQRMLDDRVHAHPHAPLSDLDVSGFDLRGLRLAGVDFERVDLSNAILSDCDLNSSSFVACTLDGADLSGANLYKAIFSRCSLRGAKLRGAILRRSSIQSSSMMEADLRDADLTRAAWGDSDLRGADLTGAIFFQTTMMGVRAYGTRGGWLRPGDNRIEGVDMSAEGDGSVIADASALVDAQHGLPRPIRIRLSGVPLTPVIVREEPHALEREIDLDSLPIDDELRTKLKNWSLRRDDVALEAENTQPTMAVAIDEEVRPLWRSLKSSLIGYQIRYASAQQGVTDDAQNN